MCGKACDHHNNKRRKIIRQCFARTLIVLFLILIIILLIGLILHPTKPRFTLQDATIFNFNVSSPNLLSSTIQITILSRNPNDNIGVYYDKLDAYATYHAQQITYNTAIPPVYQGHKDTNVWSPFINGIMVPIAPYNGPAMTLDQSNGAIWLIIKLDGRVRWKVGSFISSKYHIRVRCPAYIPFGNKNNGLYIGAATKYQLEQPCTVSV